MRTYETRRPMTADKQLERSVLEGKERDELQVTAQSLSVKTTTRTKKADMIDGILAAAGVTTNGESTGGTGSADGAGNGSAKGSASNGAAGRGRPAATLSFGPDDDAR